MKAYLGTGTRTAPKAACVQLAEVAYCLYLKGYSLISQNGFGIDKAMIFGAELAAKHHPQPHEAVILIDHITKEHTTEAIIDIISPHNPQFTVCWSPDGAQCETQITKKTGHLADVLRALKMPKDKVLNIKDMAPRIKTLRSEIRISHNVITDKVIESEYESLIPLRAVVIDKPWSELRQNENTLIVLPRDCTNASPTGNSSRKLFGEFKEEFKRMLPYDEDPNDRLGKVRTNDDNTLASMFTIRSYGFFAKNYCDYYQINAAIREIGRLHAGKTVILPIDASGLTHADRKTTCEFWSAITNKVDLQFNINA
ncbi:hypothetical protein ACP3V3_02400 [Vibrio sp. PNB22_3_1]